MWPEKSPKAHDEAVPNMQSLKKLCGLQAAMNVWFAQDLSESGFHAEVPARKSKMVGADQKVDFACEVEEDKLAMVEVEFGYVASIDRNLIKLTDAYLWKRSSLGVMICPTSAFGSIITSGGANYEQAVMRLQVCHQQMFPGPILLLGLDHTSAEPIDFSKSQLPASEALSGNGDKRLIWHTISEYRAGVPMEHIGLPDHQELKQSALASKVRTLPTAQLDMFL